MPFFFNNEARKRRKQGQDSVTGLAPVYASNSPSYALNASTAALYHPVQPQWTKQSTGPSGGSYPPYMTMTSTASLPAQHLLRREDRPQMLQPQHTWSHPHQTGHLLGGGGPHPPPVSASRSDLRGRVGDRLSDVISLIDEEAFTGSTGDLAVTVVPDSPPPEYYSVETYPLARDVQQTAFLNPGDVRSKPTAQEKKVNVFSKVDLYMNSRLPVSLPPLRVYIPTYPLLCLAAQYSASAYHAPQSSERKDFVSADNRLGTKAMVIKSIPCDDKKTIVFAIRGTSMLSVRDWGINLSTDPVPPVGFLEDQGNLCHSGFLKVARAMIRPIAARLRSLLEENPNRTSCSLLITGHSAGGAVASLLYAHMLDGETTTSVRSELNILTGCFKRVHCVTFGAPPVSLLPLQKPDTADGRLRKCLFHSFINEGDPVVRAEKTYVRSLVDLLSKPVPSMVPPKTAAACTVSPLTVLGASMSKLDLSSKPAKKPKKKDALLLPSRKLWWEVPPATLSNAGRLVVLRVPDGGQPSDVTASVVKDEQLRQVIFGDPLAHAMDLYAQRIETLAVRAVTGRAGAC